MLKTFFAAMFSSLLALLSSASFAAGGVNAAPFGMEVGAATIGQVKSAFSGKTKLQDAGQNKFTEGKMIQADGAGFDIEGIQNVLFIFDKSDVLVGVILTMNKDPKGIYKTLSSKYKTVSNKIDNHMNNGFARLEKGDSVIEIDSPHMSFTMEVRYLTKGFLSAFNKTTNSEAESKQKRKASSL